MRSIFLRLAPVAAAVALYSFSSNAHAQQVYVAPAPTAQVGTGAPPPQQPPPQQGEYVAPMPNQAPPPAYGQPMGFAGPRVITDYQAGDPVPPGYHPSTRVRGWAIGAGLGMFGAAYLPSLFVAAIGSDVCDSAGCNNVAWPLYIPVVGPFITIGTYGATSATANIFLVIDGLLQSAGAALTIWGIASPKTVLVRNDLGSLSIAPTMVAGTSPGIGLSGTFF
jgi:hypothetical protein